MAQKNISQQRAHVGNMLKVGKGRTSKIFKKKGNAPAHTSRKGNGSKIRWEERKNQMTPNHFYLINIS